jgi:hypothetical protein
VQDDEFLAARRLGWRGSETRAIQNDAHLQDAAPGYFPVIVQKIDEPTNLLALRTARDDLEVAG